MADKPIDDLKGKMLSDWQRGMLLKTLITRFSGLLTEEILNQSNDHKRTIPGMESCPVCGGIMYAKRIELQDKNIMYVPQCATWPDEKDHGFGKWSKYGNRAPMGRKPGSQNKPRPPVRIDNDQPKPVFQTVEVVTEAPPITPPSNIQVQVTVSGGKVIHPEVVRASKYVIAGERNIYFTGPAGTGKSTGAEHLHEILRTQEKWKETDLLSLTVSLSTFVSDLAGFLDRLNRGEFVITDLVKALQKPGVVVVDEADKGNPNLAGFWNVILANQVINTPGGTFKRHPDNVVVFIGNTTGHQPSKQYSGSVRQDYATLDRFRCFNVGFNDNVEKAACPNLNETLFQRVKIVRDQAARTGLQRIIGTRWLKRVNQAMQVEGVKDPVRAMRMVMQDESWSNDEILSSGIQLSDQ